jgi:hypothetical membrane protein
MKARFEALALQLGMVIPILYFGSVLAAAFFYPGFSFVRQYASELGADGAPHPRILNGGLMLLGVASVIAAAGLWCGLRRLGARPLPARWTGWIVALFGTAMGFAGYYPHPDWRHSGFGTSFLVLGGPILLATALRERREARALRLYLLGTNVCMIVLAAALLLTGHSPYAGLLQLLYSLAAIPWMGIGAFALSRYLSRMPAASWVEPREPA